MIAQLDKDIPRWESFTFNDSKIGGKGGQGEVIYNSLLNYFSEARKACGVMFYLDQRGLFEPTNTVLKFLNKEGIEGFSKERAVDMKHNLTIDANEGKFSFKREVVFDITNIKCLEEPLISLKVNFTIDEDLKYKFAYLKMIDE
ncbi:MAG: hypothetical protein P0S93_03655 [Candidatus Neptunochlamydia sp.]|nr:hypothetical protein [Candidatus Neptunochlamydia sp.]